MYKKIYADQLFTGTQLLGESVLITDENGVVEAILPLHEASDDVQHFRGILSPGFINCHCHLELSHMRGLIPKHTGLVDFVFKVVTQRHFAEEEIIAAVAKAEEEMIAGGIVAAGDICNNTLTASQKSKGNLAYYNFVEVSGWLPEIAAARIDRSLAVYDTFRQPATGNQCTLVPHAPYSVSQNLWQLLQPHYQGKTVSIHNQETSFEDELFIQGSGDFIRMYELMNLKTDFFKPSGRSSLQTYFDNLKGAANVMLVHNTFTKEADVLFAKTQAAINDQRLFFCLCPNANLYIENALPPVAILIANQCALVLGTDSLASNARLSILEEMKTIRQHFPKIETTQLLQMATLNGAAALNLNDQFGSFEKGKQPGIILLEEDFTTVKRLL